MSHIKFVLRYIIATERIGIIQRFETVAKRKVCAKIKVNRYSRSGFSIHFF